MGDFVAAIRQRYLDVFSDHMSKYADETPMYLCDLVMFGLMDRNIGLVEAMPRLIEEQNFHALAPLLRVQLDGLLRLHAFRIVDKRDDLAHHLINGNELRKFKDRNGNKLTDRHLVDSLSKEFPWVKSMYDELCGWVHFSDSHIFAAATQGEKEGSIYIGIGGFRQRIKPEVFQEATDAINEIHRTTAGLIRAYFEVSRAYNKSQERTE